MPLFVWDETYSVGIKDMDTEHQKLFGIMNMLYDAIRAGKGKDGLEQVFSELVEYTKVHFTDEEQLMQKYNYPGLTEQIKQHRIFEAKIKDEYDRFKAGALLVSLEIMNFLRDWLVNHIQGFDREYGKYLNEKGFY